MCNPPRSGLRQRYQNPRLLLVCLLLAACQTTHAPPVERVEPVPALPDAPAYRVDPAASELRVLVRRAGALSNFGHDHVVTAPVTGVVHAADSAAGSGFRLAVTVADFAVDPAAARAEEGGDWADEVSSEARDGTYKNLLGERVLDAQRHPRIEIESVAMTGPRWNPEVRARVTLRGVARDVVFPAAVFEDDGALTVIANFSIVQSEFGIEPFSILGGGLKVRDALDVRVRLVAHATR